MPVRTNRRLNRKWRRSNNRRQQRRHRWQGCRSRTNRRLNRKCGVVTTGGSSGGTGGSCTNPSYPSIAPAWELSRPGAGVRDGVLNNHKLRYEHDTDYVACGIAAITRLQRHHLRSQYWRRWRHRWVRRSSAAEEVPALARRLRLAAPAMFFQPAAAGRTGLLPQYASYWLKCFPSGGLADGTDCSTGDLCVSGFGCFGSICKRYCQLDSDCPAVDGTQSCNQTYWDSVNTIAGVSVCSRVCDPVNPQTPRSPLLACPVDSDVLRWTSTRSERLRITIGLWDCRLGLFH